MATIAEILQHKKLGANLRDQIDAANNLIAAADKIFEIEAVLLPFKGDEKAHPTWVWLYPTYMTLYYNARFSLDDCLPVRKALAIAGWHLKETNLKEDATEYPSEVTWRLQKPNDETFYVKITLEFGQLQAGQPVTGTCRRVQVGTKLEEVPVYKTVCS